MCCWQDVKICIELYRYVKFSNLWFRQREAHEERQQTRQCAHRSTSVGSLPLAVALWSRPGGFQDLSDCQMHSCLQGIRLAMVYGCIWNPNQSRTSHFLTCNRGTSGLGTSLSRRRSLPFNCCQALQKQFSYAQDVKIILHKCPSNRACHAQDTAPSKQFLS